jgi:hypothetical protein
MPLAFCFMYLLETTVGIDDSLETSLVDQIRV